MPIFELEGQGGTFEVDAPNEAAAVAAFKKMQGAQPNTLMDMAKSAGAGLGKGVIGLGGLIGDASDLLVKGADAASNFVTDKLGFERFSPDRSQSIMNNVPTSGSLQKQVEGVTGEFYKPQTTAGKYAQTLGEFAPGAVIGPGGALAKALSVAGGGLASEAAGQLTEGSAAEPFWRAGAGMVGGLGPAGMARAITPNPISPARQRLIDILEGEGVNSLTAGQRTGNDAIRYAESILGNAPGSGGRANAMQRQGQEQFTEAVMRRAGAGPDATPEVLANNSQRLGNEFERLSAQNTLTPDNQFITELTDAVRQYRNVPDSQQRALLQGYLDDIVPYVNAGAMPGTNYQPMRSMIGADAQAVRQSDPYLSRALTGIRNALDGAMNRSINPADRDAWAAARREYRAQRTIETAASRAGEATAEGQIVPANIRNADAANNRGQYARGQSQFSELSRAGSGVMAPLPNSGTGQRNAVWDVVNSATLGAIPAVSGRVLMSPWAQSYLANQALPAFNNATPANLALARALLAQDRTQLLDAP